MMNIDLSTQAAQTAVDQLGDKLEGLAPKAKAAGEGMTEGLNFAKSLKGQFSSIKDEIAAFGGALASLQKEFRAVNGEAAAHVTVTKGMADMSRMVSKALTTQTSAIRAQTTSLKASVQAGARATAEQEKSNSSNRNATRILGTLATATSSRAKDLRAINKLLKDETITAKQAARAQDALKNSYDGIGTEAEKYLATLRRTNKEMNRSQEELAEMKAGWSSLTNAQRDATYSELAIQRAWKNSGKYLKENLSPLQQYQRGLESLTALNNLWNSSKSKGKRGGLNDDDYARAIRELNGELEKSVAAENARHNPIKQTAKFTQELIDAHGAALKEERARAKANKELGSAQIQATKEDRARTKALREMAIAQSGAATEASKYLASLTRTNAEAGKSQAQLATMRAGWTELGSAARLATLQQIKVAEAIQATSGLFKQALTPMQQYEKQLAHLRVLRDEFGRTKGNAGIGEKEYATALRNLSVQLRAATEAENKNSAANLRAIADAKKRAAATRAVVGELKILDKSLRAIQSPMGRMNNDFHVGAQAAAGFRAAMHGANLGFGIFTSSTLLTATAVYGLTRGLVESIKVGAQFQRSFQRASVMMKSFEEIANGSANAVTGQTRAVRDLVLDLAETTQYTATEVADAASVLALSGQEAHEIYSNLGSVLDLASVGMMDMARAADIATGMMASFAMSGKDFERAVDIIAATAAKTKASVEDIGMSMTYIGPIAHQAGSSIEQVSAAMGILAENNIRGSKSGTALRRMFTNILSPTKAGSKAFEKLGIDIEGLTAGGVDLVKVFQALSDAGADIGDLKSIFGQYALTSAAALQANVHNFNALNIQMETQVEGFAARTRDALTENFQLAVEELQNVIQRGMIKAFDVFGPGLEKDIRGLSDALRKETGTIAEMIGAVASAVIKAAKSIIENFDMIRKVATPIFKALGVILQFAAENIGLVSSALMMYSGIKIVHGTLGLISSGFGKLSAAATGASLSLKGFNISLAAHGGLTPSFVKDVETKRMALIALNAQTAKMFESNKKLSAQRAAPGGFGAIIGGSSFTKDLKGPTSDLTKLTKAAGTATGAMALLGRGLAGIGTAFRAAIGFLGGVPGVIIAIALTALPMLIGAFEETETAAVEFSGALETIEAFEGRIGEMSDSVREKLTKDLKSDIELAKKQIETLKAELNNKPDEIKQAREVLSRAELNLRLAPEEDHFVLLVQRNKAQAELNRLLADTTKAEKAQIEALDQLSVRTKAAAEDAERNANILLDKQIAVNKSFGILSGDTAEFKTSVNESIEYSIFSDMMAPITEATSGISTFRSELAELLEMFRDAVGSNWVAMLFPTAQIEKATGFLTSAIERLRSGGPRAGVNHAATAGVGGAFGLGELGLGTPISATYSVPNQPGGGKDSDDDTSPEELREQKAALKEATAELQKYFDAYEKGTGSVQGIKRELDEIHKAQAAIKAATPAATAALKEQGYTAKEALAALDWSEAETTFSFVTQQLEKIDPRFKDLNLTMATAKEGALNEAEALAEAEAVLRRVGFTTEEVTELMKKFTPALNSVNSPAAKLAKEFEKLEEEANNLMATWNSPSTFAGMVDKFKDVKGANVEFTLATIRASKVFGDFQSVLGEEQQLEEAAGLLQILVKGNGQVALSADLAAKKMREFYDATPLGKLEEENRQLQIRLGMIGATAKEQYVMNMAVAEYGSYLEDMPDQFRAAAEANYELNEQMRRIEEVEGAFKSFGDGAARIFAGLFDKSTTGFSDMVDKFKDLFKQLLAELAYLAIKQTIMVNFGGMFTGASGGGGGGIVQQAVSAAMGTGQGGGGLIQTGAQAMMSFLGGGGGSGSKTAQTEMLRAFGITGNSTGGGMGNGTSYLDTVSGLWSAGQTVTGGGQNPSMLQMFRGSGQTTQIGSYLGTNTGGVWTPSTAGGYVNAAAGLAGATYGFTQRGSGNGHGGSIAAGLSYGALGLGAAGAVGGMLGGAGAMAGATGAFAGAGASAGLAGAAWVPVVGWILAAMAVIDLISGGKLFGTRYRPESAEQTLRLNAQGGDAQASVRDVRNRSMFQGRQWRTREVDAGDEAERAADKFFRDVQRVMRDGANDLRIETPPMIDAALRVVTEYDKKGKVKATKTFVDILGRTWEETGENAEQLAATRIMAESMIATLDAAFPAQRIADAVANPFDEGWDEAEQRIGARVSDIGEIVNNAMNGGTTGGAGITHAGEASQIAERWRDDAEMLMQGAQFLLLAGKDIRRGMGLLGEGGTLTEIADLIETLQRGEESLAETYQRVVASVQLVETTLGAFNVATGRTRTEFVEFSDELVASLGGISNATTALQTFADAFGQIGNLAEVNAARARQQRSGLMERIGLDPNTSATEFVRLFTEALPDLTASEVADWVAAGQPIANVALALRDMRAQLEGGESLDQQLQAQIAAMAAMGALPHELLEAIEIAQGIMRNALRDFMQPIRDELAAFEGDEYATRVANINRSTEEAIRQATALHASEEDLTAIRRRGEHQIAAIAKELEDFMFGIEGEIAAIEGHPVQHHLKEIARQMEANIRQARGLGASEQDLARIRRLAGYQMTTAINELRMSIRSLVSDFYYVEEDEAMADAASSRQEEMQQAAQTLYDTEMQRYEDAQEAIKNIAKFLTDLEIGDLSPGSWQDRLGAARTNFMDLFERAQGGDTDALNEITGAAQQFLELGSEFYGSTVGYGQIYDLVTSMLRSLNVTLAEVTQPEPPPSASDVTGGSSGSSERESERDRIEREAERFRQALAIAQQIGDLAMSLRVNVFELLTEYGVKLSDLAKALGINVNALTRDTATQLQMLAGALGTNMNTLISELGISVSALANSFGVSLTQFNSESLRILAEFSTLMETDIVTMAENLGISITGLSSGLATAIQEGLGALPNLPESLIASLNPFLTAIRESSTADELRGAITSLGTFVGTLPDDQREALRPLLEGLGITVGDALVLTEAQTLAAMKGSLESVAGSLSAMIQLSIWNNPIGSINAGTTVLEYIHGTLGDMLGVLGQIRDGTSGEEVQPPKKEGTWTPEAKAAAAYMMTADTQEQQAEAIEQTKAVVERLENINETLDTKLEKISTKQETGNKQMTAMKNNTRRQVMAESGRKKKGRTR